MSRHTILENLQVNTETEPSDWRNRPMRLQIPDNGTVLFEIEGKTLHFDACTLRQQSDVAKVREGGGWNQ